MDFKIIKFGVVGFSRNQFDKKSAYRFLDQTFGDLKGKHGNKIIEIVSGYTNSGIPKIAYELANKYGFTTVGFSAKQALSVRSGTFPVDKVILKGELFGDESNDFVAYIDGLIRVSGGLQSRKETTMFKEKNNNGGFIIEYEVEWYGE